MRHEVEVVHVGSACRDVAADDPRGWRLGGGVTYSALASARLGLRTAAIVGVDDEARHADELDALRAAGVDLMLVDLPEGPVFHNEETPAGRIQTVIATGVALPVVPVPGSWARAAAWSIVPVADEVADAWASSIPPEAIVALGWQGMLRDLAAGRRVTRRAPQARAVLQRADLVGVSRFDLDPSTRLRELAAFVRPGARLLVTHGDRGGLLVETGLDGEIEVYRYVPTRTDRAIDPTGAGDTFLAALLAVAVRPGLVAGRSRPGADLRFAAAAGSLVVEGVGLDSVPDRAAVLVRRARERVRRVVQPSSASGVDALWDEELAAH